MLEKVTEEIKQNDSDEHKYTQDLQPTNTDQHATYFNQTDQKIMYSSYENHAKSLPLSVQ